MSRRLLLAGRESGITLPHGKGGIVTAKGRPSLPFPQILVFIASLQDELALGNWSLLSPIREHPVRSSIGSSVKRNGFLLFRG